MKRSREYMAALGRLAQAKRTPAERARFARIGGLTAQSMGVAHQWTRATAGDAGRKGGLASVAKRAQAGRDE